MLKTTSAITIPEVIWSQVFKYLEIKTFLQLQAVCKKMKEYTSNHTEIFERETIRIYTSDLQLFAQVSLYALFKHTDCEASAGPFPRPPSSPVLCYFKY